MYIHGYGSTGNATKGQLLRKMMPKHRVVSPTFDYDHLSPCTIQEQIKTIVTNEDVKMIVGSSFGGYQTLCATKFFHGIVWAINPVHDVESTIRRVILANNPTTKALPEIPEITANNILDVYSQFNNEVFLQQAKLNQDGLWPADTPLNFALSSDDELLGDHNPLLALFPNHDKVVWKDHCGHRFYRFEELKEDITL